MKQLPQRVTFFVLGCFVHTKVAAVGISRIGQIELCLPHMPTLQHIALNALQYWGYTAYVLPYALWSKASCACHRFFKMYKVWSQIVVTAECHLAHYQESNCQDILAGIQFTGWATVQPPSAVVHVMALFSCLCIVSKFCSNQIEAHTWHDLCSWSPIPSKLCSTLLLLKRCVTGLTVSLLSDYLNCSHISSHD